MPKLSTPQVRLEIIATYLKVQWILGIFKSRQGVPFTNMD